MNDITAQEIDDALERAQKLRETSEEFIDIADGINNTARIKLEEERGIDIDSTRWVPLDDIPLGEEVFRVEDDLPSLDAVIQTLENLTEGKIPTAEVTEKFQMVIEELDTIESTLQDVGAEEVIKASLVSVDSDFFYEQDDEEYSEDDD